MGTVILVRIINNINTTGVTMGARTTYPSGMPPVHFVNLPVFTCLIPCCDFRVIKCVFHLYPHLFCQEFIFYLFYLYSFTYIGVQYYFHVRRYSCRLAVTQWESLMVQELKPLPKHMRSLSFLLVFVLLNRKSSM
jgi:hypothetical protein